MSAGIANRIGQYHYADGALVEREISGKVFKIGVAGALNAFGLIGSEHNGIFVLNDTDKQVVLDQHFKTDSGYMGPEIWQIDELHRLLGLPAREFLAFCKRNPQFRGEHTL